MIRWQLLEIKSFSNSTHYFLELSIAGYHAGSCCPLQHKIFLQQSGFTLPKFVTSEGNIK
jgi:hypothetical protein